MNCQQTKTSLEEILRAGHSSTEEQAIEFLIGLGVKTGVDLRYIDGFSAAEVTFNMVGNVFMLKKICKKVQTAAKNGRLSVEDPKINSAVNEIDSYLQKIDNIDSKFQAVIAANRKIEAGLTNVVQLRPQTDSSLKLRECDQPISTLEEVRKRPFETREDVLEFLVGMSIQPIEGVRYINGYTLRDSLRSLISTLCQMKKDCVRALVEIENSSSLLYPAEIHELHNYIQSFLHGVKVEETSYTLRVARHHAERIGGNVVPFKR
ncbi:MAG: hypothetical protein RSD49_01560 [Hafnia sp.]